jgi:hypothetical protein
VYHSRQPTAPYELLKPSPPAEPGSPEFCAQLRRAGALFRQAQVTAIYLVHGTFVGVDSLGWIRKLRRLWPAAGETLERHSKSWLDVIATDGGNYTPAYATELEAGLAAGSAPRIPVRVFCWSGENHHVGRVDGAVRLLDELMHSAPDSGRIVVYCHSHGGNVLALITNLLAADRETCEAFFTASGAYFRRLLGRGIGLSVWARLYDDLLGSCATPKIDAKRLDVVTFGTPIRYGWDSDGYGRLLHIVNHRPQAGTPEYLAEFPRKWDDAVRARGGDYVQQLGIAGTNLRPSPFSLHAFRAHGRLTRLLEAGMVPADVRSRLRMGMRVPQEGSTLLIDYQDGGSNFREHLLGHAIYTRRAWMAFHAELIATRFYGEDKHHRGRPEAADE